jgi:hypothetical protein
VFNQLMTTGAKGNEVAEFICNLVILILSVDVSEHSKWRDMVNIKALLQLLLRAPARLASVLIAIAGGASLRFPVRAVVNDVATRPVRMILANDIFRSPFTKTGFAAKMPLLGLQYKGDNHSNCGMGVL